MKIGLLFIATGKYIEFFDKVYESFEKYFMPGREKIYFLFTDSKRNFKKERNVVKIYKKYEGFPADTLFRYHLFYRNKGLYKKYNIDYLFYSDVDMLAVEEMKESDIIKEGKSLIACYHPGYYGMKVDGSNNNPKSLTYLKTPLYKNKIVGYFCGGFQGGKTDEYVKGMLKMIKIINQDEQRGTRARWHDESNWNFFIHNNLDKFNFIKPDYCYPEAKYRDINFNSYTNLVKHNIIPRLLALDKDHNYYRTPPKKNKSKL